MNWFDQHPWIMLLPLSLAFAPVAYALYGAAVGELALRVGRHRGVYEFADFPDREADQHSRYAGQVAGLAVEGFMETFAWTGSVTIPDPPDQPGAAYLTITPDVGVMNIPALIGEPPPVLTVEDFERIHRDMVERDRQERLAEINSVLYQHERVYHPLAA